MTDDEPAGADRSAGDEPPSVDGSSATSSDADGSVHRTPYDASTDGPLGAAVVVAIAEATGTPTHVIDPLYETVDPDALAELFGPTTRDGSDRRHGTVSFVHYGCRVTVDGDEIVVDTEQ